MKLFDCLGAGTLFILSIVDCLLVPKTYTGRIWIFGTGLALLFTAMLNVLRIRNGSGVKGLKLFCITANVTMLVFTIALMASIGKSRTLQHPQIPLVAALLLAETALSLGEERLIPLQEASGCVSFAVKVHPRARKNAITGKIGNALKLSLTSPPVEGRANEACIEFFAKLLKVPRSSVTIASGHTSRQKVVRVSGLSAEEVRKRIGNAAVSATGSHS